MSTPDCLGATRDLPLVVHTKKRDNARGDLGREASYLAIAAAPYLPPRIHVIADRSTFRVHTHRC